MGATLLLAAAAVAGASAIGDASDGVAVTEASAGAAAELGEAAGVPRGEKLPVVVDDAEAPRERVAVAAGVVAAEAPPLRVEVKKADAPVDADAEDEAVIGALAVDEDVAAALGDIVAVLEPEAEPVLV